MDYFQPTAKQPKKRRINKEMILPSVLTLLLLGVSFAAAYFYIQYQDARKKADNPSEVLNEQAGDLLDELKELIVIDEEEEPTIASVVDIEALKKENPQFYKNGKDGNIIFIFTTRVILYDRDEKRIVNVAPIIEVPETSVEDPSNSESVN